MNKDGINKKCDEIVRDVAQNNPDMTGKIGLGKEGPQSGSIAARAQEYAGDVKKGSDFANLQQKAMKK